MCKIITDILNVLNSRKTKTIEFDVPDTHPNPYAPQIEFVGRWVQVECTLRRAWGLPPYPHIAYFEFSELLTGSGTHTITIPTYVSMHDRKIIDNNKIYFRCKGVSSLKVDGEIII